MTSTACCSAFSPDGQYYAYCGNDGKLKIWETANGRLKHEFIPNQHLSSPCNVIEWVFVSQQSASNASVRHAIAMCHVLSLFQNAAPYFSFASLSLARARFRPDSPRGLFRSLSLALHFSRLCVIFFFLFFSNSVYRYHKKVRLKNARALENLKIFRAVSRRLSTRLLNFDTSIKKQKENTLIFISIYLFPSVYTSMYKRNVSSMSPSSHRRRRDAEKSQFRRRPSASLWWRWVRLAGKSCCTT